MVLCGNPLTVGVGAGAPNSCSRDAADSVMITDAWRLPQGTPINDGSASAPRTLAVAHTETRRREASGGKYLAAVCGDYCGQQ